MSRHIHICLESQTLQLLEDGQVLQTYPVSTSRFGPGEEKDSYKTPRGRHVIAEKIGADAPQNAVFVARRPTGEIWSEAMAAAEPGRDWILSRILWLSGCEPGRNCGGNVDTRERYVYIHGCPDTAPMGVPGSIGCIRMRNSDVIELFEAVPEGTPVLIEESP